MFYKLKIFDIERELPVLKTPSGIYIAGFNPVGDMELLIKAGDYLAKQIITEKIDFDIILTTELKGVPIAQEVARNLSCNYVCLRKSPKCYMLEPKHTSGASITSGNTDYYVSSIDLDKLKNKKVLFVDDVFSTGSTFENMLEFAKREQFNIVAGLAILKEGKANSELNFKYNNVSIFCCGFLPLPDIV